jgi:oligoendopeptidase F
MIAQSTGLPARSEVPTEDTWDLSTLFADDAAWQTAFQEWSSQIERFETFRGTLGQSAAQLRAFLDFDLDFSRQGDSIGRYAFLRSSEDVSDGKTQEMVARVHNAGSRAGQASSFMRPELIAIPDETMKQFLASPELEPYRLLLERILRFKPHTLTDREERLLAMQSEMAGTPNRVFSQLNDNELRFGEVTDSQGRTRELTQGNFISFLEDPDRTVRAKAFHQTYAEYGRYKNTICAALAGSIQGDVFSARARNYSSALEAGLFADNVPTSVYDNLIQSVRRHLPGVHRYLDVRRRAMNLPDMHHYDTYIPILTDLRKHHSWDQAVDVVMKSLEPLGSEYCGVLENGFKTRWCDRYENRGKRKGAFSYGGFDANPFILMNFQADVLDHVFTLTHEAGHAMHSHLSSAHQPYAYHDYVIFVAEVASTFNEQLLTRYLLDRAQDDRERAYLLNKEIDGIRGTIVRQTMFAEFEKISHEMAEANEPLTVESLRSAYRGLLDAYFGPNFVVDDDLAHEFLRIPHFYRAFYVYKYATGLSASIALCQRVLNGGETELNDYLSFLKGGCSKYPLDLLRDAGVDLEAQPGPVDTALDHFESLVAELDQLLN